METLNALGNIQPFLGQGRYTEYDLSRRSFHLKEDDKKSVQHQATCSARGMSNLSQIGPTNRTVFTGP